MKYRKLGVLNDVSEIGLGCMGMTHAYGDPSDKKEMISLIHKAIDLGCNFFDTAECYTGINSNGIVEYNEDLVGEALQPYREKVIIATKCGVYFNEQGLQHKAQPEEIRKSLENSLLKLRTDYIDLYYLHRVDPNVPVEVVAELMKKFIDEGKIRAWGLSMVDEETVRRADKICKVSAVENKYSLISRKTEDLFPVLEELNIGLVAYSPLASGFLSAAYNKNMIFSGKQDFRAHFKQFTNESMDACRPLIDYISELAEKKNATPAQISLAWVLAKKPYIIPIPGTRKLSRLQENFGGAELVLRAEEINKIERALESVPEEFRE